MALIWAIIFVSAAVVQAADPEPKDERYYMVVAPQKLRPQSKYEASVTVLGTDKPVAVTVGIVGTEEGNKDFAKSTVVNVPPNSKQIASFEIGELKCCNYNLSIRGDENFKFENVTELVFVEKYQSVFIQTDRAMYKPGHKVQFRVLVLDSKLAPSSEKRIDVILKDGENNRVKEWKNAEAVKGLYSNDIQLSSQPVLGDWTIIVKSGGRETTKTFTVAEYVLPKFEVKVDLPKYTTVANSKVPVEVSAKYTYGQLVKGEATIKVKQQYVPYNQPEAPKENSKVIKVDPIGKTEIDVVEALGIGNLLYDTELRFDVEFKEELTGKVLNGSNTLTIHKHSFQMFFDGLMDELVPGENYKTMLKVVKWDNTPFVGPKGEKVKVKLGERMWTANKEDDTWDAEYDLSPNGTLELSIPTEENSTSVSIHAQYMGLDAWTNGFKKYVPPVQEEKNVSLEIKLDDGKHKIGDILSIDIIVKGGPKYISYYLIGRELVDTDTVKIDEGQEKLHLDLKVKQAMAPTSHLLVSYISNDGEVTAEERYIYVENYTENFVKISAEPDDTEPGKETTITVETKPNSLVGLLGVDQSVLLLKKGNDLSESDVRDDLNGYDSPNYGRFKRSIAYPPWHRRGSSTKWTFDNAGAVVLTNGYMHEEPFYPKLILRASTNVLSLPGVALSTPAGGMRPVAQEFGASIADTPTPVTVRTKFPETWIWDTLDSRSERFDKRWALQYCTTAPTACSLRATLGCFMNKPKRPFTMRKLFPESWIWDVIDSGGRMFSSGGLIMGVAPPAPFTTIEDPRSDFPFSMPTVARLNPILTVMRKQFPETWIFDVIASSDNGVAKITKTVPDTITSWVISGFSLNPEFGLGLSNDSANVRVFRPFFVSLNLPYSVKRGESMAIPVNVFNYMDREVTAAVNLTNPGWFSFASPADKTKREAETSRVKVIKIGANSAATANFLITPNEVGYVEVKATATSPLAGDGVSRKLLVKPEGETVYKSTGVLVDLRDKNEFSDTVTLSIPDDAVPDSEWVVVSAVGDLLGSALDNLDKLIRQPYGCGEQNMLNFVPNIVILDYLTNSKQLTSSIESKALKYLDMGYQRELTYKHDDNSYSAFGKHDKSGSTWLSAFVAKSFNQAKQFSNIEKSAIIEPLRWIASKQNENGSFSEVGHVSHKSMQGGGSGGLALTAYVLTAFVETLDLTSEFNGTIDKTVKYLEEQIAKGTADVYSTAVTAYALGLADLPSKDKAFELLDSKAISAGGLKHWENEKEKEPKEEKKYPWEEDITNAINVEITAYAMLSYLQRNMTSEAIPILKWLLSQQNSQGGFASTQDTVVALGAIAKLANQLVGKGGKDMTITFTFPPKGSTEIKVNDENSLLYQKVELPRREVNKEVGISAKGTGFAVVQVSYKYNINKKGSSPAFKLNIETDKSTKDHMVLNICTSYIAGTESNMAVMEVTLPSGFTIDDDGIKLLRLTDAVKKVETKDENTLVVLYFDKVTNDDLCVPVSAYKSFGVAKQKPVPVTVYDYYDTTKKVIDFYVPKETNICDICEGDDCKNCENNV